VTDGAHSSDARERAREAALRLLAVRARSRRELERRLRRKGFDEVTVVSVLDDLAAVDLVDDASFARAWADERARLRPIGPARLRHELYQKGISREIVDRTIDETYPGDRELELARAALRRRKTAAVTERRERARLLRFLLRRGFSRAVAAAAIDELPHNQEDTEYDVE
jgi:regulatory protein